MIEEDDQHPSSDLLIAGMLARYGWTPERIARGFDLPAAFAQAVHDDALATGEPHSGDDARLAKALRTTLHEQSTTSDTSPAESHPHQPRHTNRRGMRLSVAASLCCALVALGYIFGPRRASVEVAVLLVAVFCLAVTGVQARALKTRRQPRRPDKR